MFRNIVLRLLGLYSCKQCEFCNDVNKMAWPSEQGIQCGCSGKTVDGSAIRTCRSFSRRK